MKDHRDITQRTLARVIAEAREESTPELDWARVESRLDAEPTLPEVESAKARGVRSASILAAAGIALAVGWFAAGGRAPIASPTELETPNHALDGDTLGAGTRIEAPVEEVAVEHSRHSRWTLEKGGRATVTSGGGTVRVELEEGAIVAHVVPSQKKETFVVEAAGTRVAVHGTAFRVALTGSHVDVSVTEGTVLVGPRDRPGSGQAISANESTAFTLSGMPFPEEHAARPSIRRPAPDRRAIPSVERPRELHPRPSIEEVEKVVSQVLELGATCFQSRTATANGIRVTASTLFTVRARPEGKLELVSLDPPLAPPVQSCVNDGIQKLSIPESQLGIQIARRMELER
jgi:ferric-dicitrate binding protein FerR (iron transport regulator)